MQNSYNTRQKQAIEHGEGPLMVIAGPGSGKTFVITERISYLITHLNARPGEILVVTFSRAAAEEMKARFSAKDIPDGKLVTFGTFHSVFYRVLKTAYGALARNYIFDEESMDKIRFDEMLILTKELLEERGDIRELVSGLYKWILIDEFQDIDDVQYDIIRLLNVRNTTIVGDDDQSIYGFRGSNPKIMLGFENDYPGTTRVVLNENYRSKQEILRLAANVIVNNKNRFSKDISSVRGSGGKVKLFGFIDAEKEYNYIREAIVNEIAGGCDPKDIAVLYRNNKQPWQLDRIVKCGELGINAMTFHKSKGLEFKSVWIIDANQGVTPSKEARTEEELESERRAFYVAMTRARDELNICWCNLLRGRKREKSIYIDELKNCTT